MNKELNSYLLHLYTMELKDLPSDEVLLSFINNNENDIYNFIKQSMFPFNLNLSYNELKQWITDCINKIISLSSYHYSDNEINLYINYIYYTIIQNKISPESFNINSLINELEELLGPVYDKGSNCWYCQEQLRLILLHILNLNQEIFEKNIEKIKIHLFIAKKNVNAIKEFQKRKEC